MSIVVEHRVVCLVPGCRSAYPLHQRFAIFVHIDRDQVVLLTRARMSSAHHIKPPSTHPINTPY